jgi:transcriptional regulator with XRE-family HTH domain
MTPFGVRVRALRAERGITLKKMAADLALSPAYLSALEHGRRGRPTPVLIHQVCGYFGIIWDDAEDLARTARLSHPKIKIETAGLSAKATELANLLAEQIAGLDEETLDTLLGALKAKSRGGGQT